jgi:hypothetical protein
MKFERKGLTIYVQLEECKVIKDGSFIAHIQYHILGIL